MTTDVRAYLIESLRFAGQYDTVIMTKKKKMSVVRYYYWRQNENKPLGVVSLL